MADREPPSIHFLYLLYPEIRVTGSAEASPSCDTLEKLPLHLRAKYKQATICTPTHTYGQFRAPNSSKRHVFGPWEEAGEPVENPRRHWENIQHDKKDPSVGIKVTSGVVAPLTAGYMLLLPEQTRLNLMMLNSIFPFNTIEAAQVR